MLIFRTGTGACPPSPQIVRNISCGIIIKLSFDMMPIFLYCVETWRYVLAASKHHTIDVTKHFGNIRTVVSFGTHKETCIITQIADTIGIELIGRYGAAFIIYVRSFYLWQHGHINACQSKGLHDIGAKLIIRIGTPRNGNFQLFPIIISACLRAYATEDDDNCGYKPLY